MTTKNTLQIIYKILYSEYGPQGWWPLISFDGSNPTKTGSVKGYHVGEYSLPANDRERYEIIVGAILTQNTSWPQVEKALHNLEKLCGLNPKKLLELDGEKIKEAIRPAGYFNQKTKYLRNITKFFLTQGDRVPTRSEVFALNGVGNETADAIMLYAFKQPEFVIDAYTKRIFVRLGLIKHNFKYNDIKEFFEKNVKRDLITYQEYHALIVEHAKRFCKSKPECDSCILAKNCKKNMQ